MNYTQKCNDKAMKISQEKRQEYLDLLWKGKTIGEAREIIDVDFETALGIFELNLVQRKELNKTSV